MRIFSLILAVTGFVSLSSNARGDETIPPDVLAAIKKATVFVKVQVEGRSFSGSGFVVKVDDGAAYIVTNHHVIEPHLVEIVAEWRSGPRSRMPTVPHGPSGRNGPRTYAPPVRESPVLTPRFVARTLKNAEVTVVFQSGTPQEESLRAEVLAADPEVDLAILKAVDVKNLPIPVDCNRDVELTETMPVYSFGFPFGQVLATSKGSPAITIGKASISSLRRDDAGDLALVQIDGAEPRQQRGTGSRYPGAAGRCRRGHHQEQYRHRPGHSVQESAPHVGRPPGETSLATRTRHPGRDDPPSRSQPRRSLPQDQVRHTLLPGG